MPDLSNEDRSLYNKYARLNLPRHTSYPIVPFWNAQLSPQQKTEMLKTVVSGAEVSLYVHIPFCRSLCYYCGCTREIVGDDPVIKRSKSGRFLANLKQELAAVHQVTGTKRIRAIHFGGGTPTFLSPDDLRKLVELLQQFFNFDQVSEFNCEIDPRVTTREQLETLKGLGCNRLSLGVQDFNDEVQQTVNRVQPFSLVQSFVAMARGIGFREINFDLIYGLPGQTVKSVCETIDLTLSLRPSRIAYYRLAVIPEIFKWQKAFARQDLPGGDVTLAMMLAAIEKFEGAGYQFIGLDHFALPDDKLFSAMAGGSVTRNFQGMTTGAQVPILGFGPSAISSGPDFFYQNKKEFSAWAGAIESSVEHDPVERGLRLSKEDCLRQGLLQSLYCYGQVDLKLINGQEVPDWQNKFSREIRECQELQIDRILTIADGVVQLTPVLGRLLVRVVAAVFDGYLPAATFKHGLAEGQSSRTG